MKKDNDEKKGQAQVRRALARGDASGLTANDVLLALKNEGIDDLDALAKKLLYLMRPSAEETIRKAAMPIDYQLILQPDPKEPDPTITHRRPAKPFMLDGGSHAPEEISRFDGRPLYFVPTGGLMDDQKLVVFQDKTPLLHYALHQTVASQIGPTDFNLRPQELDYNRPRWCWKVRYQPGSQPGSGSYYYYQEICGYEAKNGNTSPPSPPSPPLPPLPPLPPSAKFFQHAHLSGNSFSMEPGLMYPDLTTLYRSGTSLFEDADWNDVISSIYLDQTSVLCYEHVGFHGSALMLGLGQEQGDDPIKIEGYLESLGWNDRISSIICWTRS